MREIRYRRSPPFAPSKKNPKTLGNPATARRTGRERPQTKQAPTAVESAVERDEYMRSTQKARGPFTQKGLEALDPPAEGQRRVRYNDSPNLSIELERLPSGKVSRYWRYDYTMHGNRRRMNLGVFPEVGIADARALRDAANKLVAAGTDPAHHRAVTCALKAKEATTLVEVGAMWIAKEQQKGRLRLSSLERYRRNQKTIEHYGLGKVPIGPLSTDLERLQDWLGQFPAAQARTLCQHLARIFVFGIARGYCTGNPAEITTKGRDLPAHEEEHYRAITDPAEVGALMRAIRGDCSDVGRMATEFLALTLVRPANVWAAEWTEIDMDKALWTIPAAKMKKDRKHLVPLSRQALAILRAMQPSTCCGPYVFTGTGKPLSRQTFRALSQRIGWAGRHTAQGFRSTASTILHNSASEHGFRPPDAGLALDYYRAIEEQLAHRNSLAKISGVAAHSSRPYDRNDMMAIRTELMQFWADRLDMMASDLRLVGAA
jgi:integrase